MRKTNNLPTMLLPILAMLVAAPLSNAQELIVVDQFSESVDLTDTPWDLTISLPQYNPADYGGSVLAEIMFTLNGEAVSTVDLTAVTDSNVLEGEVGAIVSASNSSLGLQLNALPMGIYAPPTIDVPAGETTTLADVAGMDTDMITLVGSEMTPYIGDGEFTIDLGALGTSSQSLAGGNLDGSHRTQANAVLTVEYKIVPEPATGTMIAFGLLGLLGFRRRK